MIPLGLSQAGTVRVGLALGRGDLFGVRRAAMAIIALSVVVSIVGSLIFALRPMRSPRSSSIRPGRMRRRFWPLPGR